ncbi:hypothetical protein K435DRAFT_730021 [Dendrothele bispora CBS 962.96]|uniref:Peroxisomal biogenesis factor 11 n=1 Tax=Dendrothele bispora (strain CBS 962.96) TaxID=1314807 RepID=A0A4S8LER1_DENBC|nr:hypothetical protein K435DRAFT_969987 [Dendrothele bispora CBS 962.96]THU88430.1 hypothetical protein K435DRAFT_730021 [Dendrothele bispora CBS 962.96]
MSLSKSIPALETIISQISQVVNPDFIDHLVRYLGTWSGTDKLFTILQYTLKLLIPLLNLRARLQYRAGLRTTVSSDAATRLGKFASTISDSRTLWRFWGLLPIIQWLISLERNPHPTKKILGIERLQAWSMMGYYPLEHLAYLASHEVIPPRLWSFSLSPGAMSIWSCRFWAAYVVLQIAHLREDWKHLQARTRSYRKAKGTSLNENEKVEVQKRWDAYWNELLINIANLPLALNWSMENGFIKSDVLVSILNLVAALASFRSGWKATALPSSSATEAIEPQEPTLDAIAATGYEVTD